MKSCQILEKEYQASYYQQNKEAIKERHRQYYIKNKTNIAAKAKASREACPELTKLVSRLTYEANRESVKARSQARRLRLKKEKELTS
jgi:hypothetical protein